MKIGVRKPSLKKAIKASTTGKAKRAVKKAVNPLFSPPELLPPLDPLCDLSGEHLRRG